MKFTLLACLFFSSTSSLAAPMGYSRTKATTAIASPTAGDKIITEIITITITATPTASNTLPNSTPPSDSTPTFTDQPSTTSSQAPPQETTPSQALLNAQEAQKLNSIFRDFKLTDTCVTGTSACVEGAVVGCVAERWVGPIGDPCSESEQCFAVPVDSLNESGIKLVCMAEQTAASLFTAAGATGGVFGGQD